MGLDTSHNCWHGSYSSFNSWRDEIAKAAGLPPLDLMDGFWESPRDAIGGGLASSIRVAAGILERASYQAYPKKLGEDISKRPHERLLSCFDFEPISWECLKPDPLHELLHHSDCDGEIEWKLCRSITESLERVIKKMPYDWHKTTQQFIDGLMCAHECKENVNFH